MAKNKDSGAIIGLVVVLAAGLWLYDQIGHWIWAIGALLLLLVGFAVKDEEKDTRPQARKSNNSKGRRNDGETFTITLSLDDDDEFSIPSPRLALGKWYGCDQSVEVKGFTLPGLVFVGKTTDSTSSPGTIDPNLKVKDPGSGEAADTGYWPSYRDLAPEQRYRYLQWLSGGMGAVEDLGYPFLYFYGFEAYILVHAPNLKPEEREHDLRAIEKEIRRMLQMYSASRSFRNYAQQLLEAMYILYWPDEIDQCKASPPSSSSLACRYVAARQAAESGRLMDADWALQWAITRGCLKRTKAIVENYSLLRALFKIEFQRAFGEKGMKVPTCKTALQLDMYPAASGLWHYSSLPTPKGWCDPTALVRPERALQPLADAVKPTLRSIAKAIHKKDMPALLVEWPTEDRRLMPSPLRNYIEQIQTFCRRNPQPTLTSLAKVLRMESSDSITKSNAKMIARALENAQIMMAPNPTLTPCRLTPTTNVVLYEGKPLEALSPEAHRVEVTVRLGSIVAQADGVVHEHEERILRRLVDAHPNTAERQYLHAYTTWRLNENTSLTGLKAQIERLDASHKEFLSEQMVEIAYADGYISKHEVKELEKLFAKLGLEKTQVSQMLHQQTTASPQPAAPSTSARTDDDNSGVVLDMARLRQFAKETEDIQSVLDGILSEEAEAGEEEAPQTADTAPANGAWHGGRLDAQHEKLVERLLDAEEWEEEDLRRICDEMALPMDGAIEHINEVTLDLFGDVMIELGDPVYVYADVIDTQAA